MSKASKALLQLIPVAAATGYAAYVIQDRFEFHDQVREEKIRKRRERQAEEVAAARAGLPPPQPPSSTAQEKKFGGW